MASDGQGRHGHTRFFSAETLLHLLELLHGNAHAKRLPARARGQKEKRRDEVRRGVEEFLSSVVLHKPILRMASAIVRRSVLRLHGRADERRRQIVILPLLVALRLTGRRRRGVAGLRTRLPHLLVDVAVRGRMLGDGRGIIIIHRCGNISTHRR